MKWEDYQEIAKKVKESEKEWKPEKKELTNEEFYGDADYVWAPEKGTAIVIYILAMIFGSIFHARILVWIVATLIFSNFMDRHKK